MMEVAQMKSSKVSAPSDKSPTPKADTARRDHHTRKSSPGTSFSNHGSRERSSKSTYHRQRKRERDSSHEKSESGKSSYKGEAPKQQTKRIDDRLRGESRKSHERSDHSPNYRDRHSDKYSWKYSDSKRYKYSGEGSGYSKYSYDYSKHRRRSLRDDSPQSSDERHRERRRSITPINLKKSKLNNWDVPPEEFPNVIAQQLKAAGYFPIRGIGQYGDLSSAGLQNADLVDSASREALEAGKRNEAKKGSDEGYDNYGAHQSSPGSGSNSVQANSAKQAKKLYVGNLPSDVKDEALIHFMNKKMIERELSPEGSSPVLSVHINRDKNFAFVEFGTPEEATTAISLDGVVFSGQNLKIRRPKDYQSELGPSVQSAFNVPGAFSTNFPDSSDKIFIGGLPMFLNEEQVMELLKSFGQLKAFNLVKDSVTGVSKGFAFCEYADPSVTDTACQGLNGMEVGDKKLIVQRASVGAGVRCGPPSGLISVSDFQPLSSTTIPSNTLLLLNMFVFEDIASDKEYKEIMEEIREECNNYGEVVSVNIPRSPDLKTNPFGIAKVYVEFATVESCSKALNSLAGRKFLDNTVIVTYYNQPKTTSQ